LRNPGIIDTFQRIIQHDSPAGLWRGVGPTLLRNTLGVGLYFVTLNKLAALLARPDGSISDGATLVAGASARSLSVCVLCPLSVVKTRLELAEFSSRYKGAYDALRQIAAREGVRGLFSGLTPSIIRDAPYSAVFVLIYLRTKEAMGAALGLAPAPATLVGDGSVAADSRRTNAKAVGMAVNFASGGLGGGLATLLTQPQDMIKTRVQIMEHVDPAPGASGRRTGGHSVVEAVRTVYAEAGVAGFFRGAYPRFLKRMLGSAITWMIFEETVRMYAAALPPRSDGASRRAATAERASRRDEEGSPRSA
jgi:solute carrier family 25, member 38